MAMRQAFAFCLVSLFVGAAGAAGHDGNWWRDKISEQNRLGYLIGYVDAVHNAALLAPAYVCSDSPKLLECTGAAYEAMQSGYKNFLSGKATYGQLKDGVDVFYSDYRNRNIGLGGALNYVVNSIAGVPASELERSVEAMRKSSQ